MSSSAEVVEALLHARAAVAALELAIADVPRQNQALPSAAELLAVVNERDALRETARRLQARVDELEAQEGDLRDHAVRMQDQAGRSRDERDDARRERDEARQRAAELDSELASLRRQVEELEHAVGAPRTAKRVRLVVRRHQGGRETRLCLKPTGSGGRGDLSASLVSAGFRPGDVVLLRPQQDPSRSARLVVLSDVSGGLRLGVDAEGPKGMLSSVLEDAGFQADELVVARAHSDLQVLPGGGEP